ncbi:hypothetical protein KBZ10_02020 [Streptomyces sp. F63]|uniref:hypothetical protein n=1 Tax=Streptomyces sp. F63 TaxID=2824887 RepID=UPI001B395DAC|nr:hypothetical protein [Streptomyces sp. F63]MBQ0983336.1 hypothetical protein [Streptomyces sp. F63]
MKRLSVAAMTALALAPAIMATSGMAPAVASTSENGASSVAFSISALVEGETRTLGPSDAHSARGEASKQAGFSVEQAKSGERAVVDRSSIDEGIAVSSGSDFVDLSWRAYTQDARYVVLRDGRELAQLDAGVSSFRDASVEKGAEYEYQVAPILPEDEDAEARRWGVKATVPNSESPGDLQQTASVRAAAAAAATTTTLSWVAFIPQSKINAPSVGCSYGRGYQFGGDGRGYDWRSNKYRAALHATIKWSNKKVTGNKSVKATTVYKKSTGRKVATKTATSRNMQAKKLGSSRNSVDIRMKMLAQNPFCSGILGVRGGINGAFTINMTKGGNWSIRSGNHRLMPNHHIYIYDGGRVTNVYKRKYASVACLIGNATCPEANLTGYQGSY